VKKRGRTRQNPYARGGGGKKIDKTTKREKEEERKREKGKREGGFKRRNSIGGKENINTVNEKEKVPPNLYREKEGGVPMP